MTPPKGKKKVAIVGFTETKSQAPYDDPECEIWGCNELAICSGWAKPCNGIQENIPRWTRWFELHSRDVYSHPLPDRNEDYMGWLRNVKPDRPIYMQRTFEDIPASVVFPLDDLEQRFGMRYFASTIGFELALAIAEGFEWIGIYGIDLSGDSEYAYQRPNAEYFIGLARGCGIEVYVCENSALLKSDHLYGYEPFPFTSGPISMAFLQARNRELAGKLEDHKAIVHTIQGALEENTNYQRVLAVKQRGGSVIWQGAKA